MNDRSEQQLLADVLAESSPPEFRAALLAETLRLARRCRQRRRLRQASGILIMAVLAGFLAWQNRTVEVSAIRPMERTSPPKGYQLVETYPIRAGAVVTTKSVAGPGTVSSSATVEEVATSSGGFRFINDDQLLALTGPRPAMLVRTGPNSEELVFADAVVPDDSQRGKRAN